MDKRTLLGHTLVLPRGKNHLFVHYVFQSRFELFVIFLYVEVCAPQEEMHAANMENALTRMEGNYVFAILATLVLPARIVRTMKMLKTPQYPKIVI